MIKTVFLFPFAILYGVITWLRNKLFDFGILKFTSFNLPVICIGNLSAGGTGKTPLTHYVLNLFSDLNVAVLSRGYGRRSKGFILADNNASAANIGDEPMTYYKAFHLKNITVAVCESRVEGINRLITSNKNLRAIVLDDAFQHRAVKAGLNILVTDFSKLYSNDSMLPVGTLREYASGAKRAQIIVVSKCPVHISAALKQSVIENLKPAAHQQIFFSYMRYGDLMHQLNDKIIERDDLKQFDVLLLTGIANAKPLYEYLNTHCNAVTHLSFADHHTYGVGDIIKTKQLFDNIAASEKIIVTTEKDLMRLHAHELIQHTNKLPIYAQTVRFDFDENDKSKFNQLLLNYAGKN